MLVFSACHKEEKAEPEAAAPVEVAPAKQETIRRIVHGDGVLYPRNQASVMPKVAAPVAKFYVNRGDHVKAGQLLARLENRDLVASAAEARGALEQAQSNLRATRGAAVPEAVVKAQSDLEAARQAMDATKKVLDSRRQLFQEGALARRLVEESQVAYVQAQANFQSAQEHLRALQSVSKQEQVRSAGAQVDAARSHWQSLEAQVAYSEIRSPIGGVVSDRPLYEGEMATPPTPVLTVIDISRVVARVNVAQAEASAVRVGQDATLTQSESGQELHGKVTVVSPATDPNSTTVQIWIQADNPGERFKPGATVHAAIAAEVHRDATVVPAAAILPGEDGGTAVLTVTADSVAHKKAVTIGVREGDRVQILSGVAPGEQVVVQGGMGVDDKAKVRVINSQGKPEAAGGEADEKGGK